MKIKKIDDVRISTIKLFIGINAILLGLVGIINTGYISQTITIMFTFVFGFVAYWFIFPLLIGAGVFLIIKRNENLKPLKSIYTFSIAFGLFALLIMTSVLAYYPRLQDIKALDASTFAKYFYESWIDATKVPSFLNYMRYNPLNASLGGGFFGYMFAGLLNSLITPVGTLIASCIILALALSIGLFKPVKYGLSILKKKHLTKVKTEEQNKQKEAEILIEQKLDAHVVNTATLASNVYYHEESETDEDFKHANPFDDDAPPTFDAEEEFSDEIKGAELPTTNIVKETKENVKVEIKKEKPLKPYVLPSLDLLFDYDNEDSSKRNDDQAKLNQDIINRSFERLHIGAKAISYTIGPRVTRFDIQIDENASIQAIPKYVKDIGQRLGGVRPRFEEIVTGKMTSGLEVPNATSSPIGFKEIVKELPKGDKNILTIPFGKDISGEIKYANLAKFPHMLVAGSTGSGKSVFIHSIIMSLIMRNTPDDLRLMLVDPKQVEFTKYRNSPFLLCPTIIDPNKAKIALEKLCEEMDRRYSLFSEKLTNQITLYNEIMKDEGKKGLPYIVVIVDEFADLIQQNKKIDLDINRIAQKARAAGIHLIIATQRPSVDVITGTIKSNLPVRVALFVSDQESSKTILGCQGAEGLLGNGDMLVSCPQVQTQGNFRAQSPFVQEKEIAAVTKFINEQREPTYDPRFLDLDAVEVNDIKNELPKISAAELKAQSDDQLYELIKESIYKRGYTSISSIQREFEIGFNRAGRMFTRLLQERLINPVNESSKGNKVLKENFNIEKTDQMIGSAGISTTTPNGEDL